MRPRRGYGEILRASGTGKTNYAFTGESFDPQTGLTYLRARYYSAYLNRFTQPDTMEPEYLRPQSINLYSYVQNNPIIYVDPSGFYLCEDSQNDCSDRQMSRNPNLNIYGYQPDSKNYSEKVKPNQISFTPSNIQLESVPGIRSNVNFAQKFDGHTGLCGQISIAWILANVESNITAQTVVNYHQWLLNTGKVIKCKTDISGCVIDPKTGRFETTTMVDYTGTGDLKNFINAAFPNEWRAFDGVWTSDGLEKNVIASVKDAINFTILGFIVDGSSGQLRKGINLKFNSNGKITSHWGVITGISTQWDIPWKDEKKFGSSPWKWVRIYNPYDNGTEYYWWGDLQASWLADGGAYVRVTRVAPKNGNAR